MKEENHYYDIARRNIKKYRELKGLTQQELADKVGVSMNYIAKIESIKMKKSFTLEVLGRIADGLNIDIRKLFDDVD